MNFLINLNHSIRNSLKFLEENSSLRVVIFILTNTCFKSMEEISLLVVLKMLKSGNILACKFLLIMDLVMKKILLVMFTDLFLSLPRRITSSGWITNNMSDSRPDSTPTSLKILTENSSSLSSYMMIPSLSMNLFKEILVFFFIENLFCNIPNRFREWKVLGKGQI